MHEGTGWGRRWVVAMTGVALAAGCTSVVPGAGRAAPGASTSAVAPTTAPDVPPAPEVIGPAPTRSSLAADVVADECLLDALGFSALLGEPVLPPEPGEVTRADGSSSTSCVAESASDSAEPLAAINVYEPRSGTPAEFVRAGAPQGRRDLPGVGEAAILVDTTPGVTLQLAGSRYVVTIAVLVRSPSDEAWRTAATGALAALPG